MSGEVEEGDSQAGLYAKEVCANCHDISNAQSPVPEATAFTEIANETGMSAKGLGRAAARLSWSCSCFHRPRPGAEGSAPMLQDTVGREVWRRPDET